MALRLVVWASTKTAGRKTAPQRGDVVEILSADQNPGKAVLGSPDWRVIDLPASVTLEDVEHLLARDEPALLDEKTGAVSDVLFRAQNIDLDTFEHAAALKMKRTLRDSDVLTATKADLLSVGRVKQALANPLVI